MSCEKVDLKSLSLNQVCDFLQELGEPKFRGKQIYQWLHEKHVDSWDETTNVSKSLREKLKENCTLTSLKKERFRFPR